MIQSIPTWPTVDAKGRILETLTLARRLLAECHPSVPRSLSPSIQIQRSGKNTKSPAWNAWGKLLIAYKATKAQSKAKHTKNIQKDSTENLLWQISSNTILLKSTESSKRDFTKSWLRKSCCAYSTCAPGKQPGICPCHPCIAPGKATICDCALRRCWEHRQLIVPLCLPWKAGRNPELL